MRINILLICVLSGLLLTGACTSAGKGKKKSPKPPAWTLNVPTDNTYIYAVGISGRTMYPTHAIKYATENARRELADMIKTRIVSFVQTKEQGRREDVSMETVSLTEEDLQGSEKVSHWVDTAGKTGVAPGTTYVLMRLERKKYEALLRKYR
jgi:hypothetical protein